MARLPSHLEPFLPLAALPERLSVALWGELCERLRLKRASPLLGAMLEAGMLKANGEELVLCLSRKKQKELVAALSTRDPLLCRRAHQACAAFFARRGAAFDLAFAVKHSLALGDRPRATALLARWGYAAIAGRWVPSLLQALQWMTEGDAPIAGFLHYLNACALEHTGELSLALSAYQQALSALQLDGQLGAERPRWLPRQAQIAARAGLLAIRMGQIQCAFRMLDAGRRLSGKRIPAAVHHLAARLCLAQGDLSGAVRQFRRATKAAARAKDAAEEAEAASGLGVVAMRSGDPRRAAEHYRQALACGGRGELRIARIQANLAMALVLIGQFSEATRLFEDAARIRESLGDLAGAANSFAACASAREGASDLAGALADLGRARHLATLAADPALELEIHLLRGMLSLRRGEVAAGRACLRRARAIRARIEAPDPLLEAMLAEASAELAFSTKQYVAVAKLARSALQIVRRNGASYIAARIRFLFARNAFAAGRRASALRHLHIVATHVIPMGIHFPHAWASAKLLELGLSRGSEHVKRFCAAAQNAKQTASPRTPPSGTGSYRILDRSGARLASEAEVARLRLHPPDLLMDLPRQQLHSPQGQIPVGARRILIPLLLTFLEHRDHPLDAEELHREVWGVDRFDEASHTRLKVALSRLRTLLGPGIIETLRTTDPAGEAHTHFVLSPKIHFTLIDHP